jgi:MFS family permease
MHATIDVRRELDESPVRPFHWMIVTLVGVAAVFDGYDTVNPAYVIHYVARPWHLGSGQAGFLVSAGLIGFAIGSVFHGVIADRIGRRPTLIAGLLIGGVFSVLTAVLANSFGTFVTLRILTGIGLGVILPLGISYLNEYLNASWRNLIIAVGSPGFMVGAVLASVAGILLTPTWGWQSLYWLGISGLVVAGLFVFLFPESAEYLVARGRSREIVGLLSRLRPERRERYETATFVTSGRVERGRGAWREWTETLAPRYLRTTLCLWVTAFFVLFCIYGLQGWTPTVMIQRGAGFGAGFAFGALLQGFGIIGGWVAGYVADRLIGQRLTIVVFAGLGALSALLVAQAHQIGADIGGVAALGFFIIGAQGILNNLTAMSYPVQARAAGEGFMLGLGRIGGLLGPFVGGVLMGAFRNPDVLFVAVAVAAALSVLAIVGVQTGRRASGAARSVTAT